MSLSDAGERGCVGATIVVARVGFPHGGGLTETGRHKGVPYSRPSSVQPYIRVGADTT